MSLSKQEFTAFIRAFDFRSLFNEMGWGRDNTRQSIVIDSHTYQIESAGQKSGFKILVCSPDSDGRIPDSATRKKIETRVKRLFEEHLIIFHDAHKSEQIWQYVVKQPGKPRRIAETRWNKDQAPELLFQRAAGVYFEIDEEENITIVDVTSRIAANFDQNNEKVTKRFYERFTKEHKAFAEFVTGIDDHIDEWNRTHSRKEEKKENQNKQWYVSLMLNRLMFCYFIQKKGFLNKDKNYLRNKLTECRARRGTNQYYSFYRHFLLALFHSGLGAPEHSAELETEIGRIPYLNGGLFDEHQLEKQFEDIQISDDAFEKIFAFFDQYEWHLDTRDNASGREINPDVIGYIFEKYINERASMGAYYTKEDITDYISKNCILPFLFDKTKRHYPNAFTKNGEIWSMLRKSGDGYIYDAVKHGINVPYPPEIEVGLDTSKPDLLDRRKDWNKKAPVEAALPTEIWREVVDRRRRYSEAKAKIEAGEITQINDFITYNLNIRQFVLDCVQNTEDAKFLEHFYKSIAGHIPSPGSNEMERHPVSILDPTCGSGAFLFAALNILEELYSACIQRMEDFIEDEDNANADDKANFKNQYAYFRDVLANVKDEAKHPNRQYFIFKSIILNNLYGVDIMKEAVEVAKLRLFLKLVATVDADYSKHNLGLEPLPDIDFNIRAGNTLIGYVSQSQIENLAALLISAKDKEKVVEECDVVARAYRRFKECQLDQENDFASFKKAKDDLQTRLNRLDSTLNRTLFKEHYEGQDYDAWHMTHQPFHWLAEYFEIIHDRGGFDVIIGNPPYVVHSKRTAIYLLTDYETSECGDLYAFVIERSSRLVSEFGALGMIVPISIVSTDAFGQLRRLLEREMGTNWYSSYSMRPGKLFDGVEKHLSIFLGNKISSNGILSAKYHRWNAEERDFLFSKLTYTRIENEILHNDSIPKIGTLIEARILRAIKTNNPISQYWVSTGNHVVYHTRKLRYFLQFLDTPPKIYEEDGSTRLTSELKEIKFGSETDQFSALSVYLSNLFFWYYATYSDCRNVNKREVATFPLSLGRIAETQRTLISATGKDLIESLQENSYFQEATYQRYGNLRMQVFQPRLSKPLIDEIDKVLAEHYGFTDEELDFIINYDIKYRMGDELDADEE